MIDCSAGMEGMKRRKISGRHFAYLPRMGLELKRDGTIGSYGSCF